MKRPVLLNRVGGASSLAAIFFGAALAAISMTTVEAAPLEVNNHSFENNVIGGGNPWTNTLDDPINFDKPQWTKSNEAGNSFIELISGGAFSREGRFHVGVQNGNFIFQNTEIPWEANKKYTLTVGVGNRNNNFTPANSLVTIGLTNDSAPNDPAFLFGFTTQEQLAADALLVEASVTIDSEPLTPDNTFTDVTMEFITGDPAPAGNVVVFLGDTDPGTNAGGPNNSRGHFDFVRVDVSEDLDGDDLPTDWEIANGLLPDDGTGVNGRDGDLDEDGRTNFEEFTDGTKANVKDTDEDNLEDGDEVTEGTDPLNPDTDGDTLLDGDEVSGAGGAATSPLERDSDFDGFEDHVDTDPNDSAVFPTQSGDVTIGLNFVGGRLDGTPGANPTSEAGVVPQENWNGLEGAFGTGAAVVDSTGAATILRVDWVVDSTNTVSVDAPQPGDGNSELMLGHLRTRQGVTTPTEVTVWNIPYDQYDVYVYADEEGADSVADYTVNGSVIAGVLDVEDWPIFDGGGVFTEVVEDGGAGNYMVFRGVTGSTMTLVAESIAAQNGAPVNAIQIVRSTADVDGDELLDLWEARYGLSFDVATGATGENGKDGDPDEDGRTNFQEQADGTNPKEPDSDLDGLNDGEEAVAGTNPNNPDSDDDGRPDGDEVKGINGPVTNPNVWDSDDDGWRDGDEVIVGTDPNSAGSQPLFAVPIGYWPFDDQGVGETTEDIAGQNDGTLVGAFGVPTPVPGHSGQPGDFGLFFDFEFGDELQAVTTELSMNQLPEVTMMGWVQMTDPDPAVPGQTIQGNRTGLFGQNDANEMGFSNDGTLAWWMPGAPGQIEFDVFPVNFTQWVHVAVVGDGDGRRVYINGEDFAASQSNGTDANIAFNAGAGSAFTFNIGGGGIWDNGGAANTWNSFYGLMDDVAIWSVALTADVIKRIADGEVNPLGQLLGGGGDGFDFKITAITRDPGTNQVSITFTSEAGVTYELQRLDEATGLWLGLDDITGQPGETTFAPFTANQRQSNYRVKKAD